MFTPSISPGGVRSRLDVGIALASHRRRSYLAAMPREHGHVGRYPAYQRRLLLLTLFILMMICMALSGCFVGLGLRGTPEGWWGPVYLIGGNVVIATVGWWSLRWINRNEDSFFNFRKGSDGEAATAHTLRGLPDTFHIVHGIELSHGDIDHLVIGPTGIFALDSKAWSGHYEVDANGRLMRNGKPVTDGHAAKLQRRLMNLRAKIVVPGGTDPFIQGAMVFVDSNVVLVGRSIGHIDVVPLDGLLPYLTRTQGRRGLAPEEIELLALRAKGLVPMEA